jgi:NADH-quinone oxidoreductase subunit C
MDAETLVATLQAAVPEAQIVSAPGIDPQTTFYASRDEVPALALALRDRPELAFDFLAELTAVDYWPKEPRYEVVYVLVSIANRLRVRMKVRLSGDDPHVATVSGIWPAANWLEREVYDMFGVLFTGHPDRRRILMPDDWQGFPQRKDYPLEGPGELLMENPEDWLKLRQAREQADIE